MRITQQLALLTFSAIVVIAVVGSMSFFCVRNLTDSHRSVNELASALQVTQEVCYHIAYASAAQRAYLITGKDSSLDLYHAEVEQTRRILEQLRNYVKDSPDQKAIADRLENDIAARIASLDTTIQIYETKGENAAFARIRSGVGLALMAQTVKAANELTDMQMHQLQNGLAEADVNSKNTQLTILLGSVLAVAIVSFSNLLFSKSLTSAVNSLLKASQNAARDRFESLADIRSGNELGDLGTAFNTLIGQLKDKSDELERSASQTASTEAELKGKLVLIDTASRCLEQVDNVTEQSLRELASAEGRIAHFMRGMKEVCDQSEPNSVLLQKVHDATRTLTNCAEDTLQKAGAGIELQERLSDQMNELRKTAEDLKELFPKTKEFVRHLDAEANNLSVLATVSSLSTAKSEKESQPELRVFQDRLHAMYESLSSVKSNLSVSLAIMDDKIQNVFAVSGDCTREIRSINRPLVSLAEQSAIMSETTKQVRSDLGTSHASQRKQTITFGDLMKDFDMLQSILEKQMEFVKDVRGAAIGCYAAINITQQPAQTLSPVEN